MNAMQGSTDFGGIHMLLNEDVNVQFCVKTTQSFEQVTSSPASKEAFANQFANDMALSLGIPPHHIRVLELAKGSVHVKFLVTSGGVQGADIKQWANNLSQMLANPSSAVYSGKVTSSVVPQQYEYGFVPVFHKFQLSTRHFDTAWNRDYSSYKVGPASENRGGEPFFPPAGWFRHALDVKSKYSDQTWLGMNNSPGMKGYGSEAGGEAVD